VYELVLAGETLELPLELGVVVGVATGAVL
jgi:hypothetical protein